MQEYDSQQPAPNNSPGTNTNLPASTGSILNKLLLDSRMQLKQDKQAIKELRPRLHYAWDLVKANLPDTIPADNRRLMLYEKFDRREKTASVALIQFSPHRPMSGNGWNAVDIIVYDKIPVYSPLCRPEIIDHFANPPWQPESAPQPRLNFSKEVWDHPGAAVIELHMRKSSRAISLQHLESKNRSSEFNTSQINYAELTISATNSNDLDRFQTKIRLDSYVIEKSASELKRSPKRLRTVGLTGAQSIPFIHYNEIGNGDQQTRFKTVSNLTSVLWRITDQEGTRAVPPARKITAEQLLIAQEALKMVYDALRTPNMLELSEGI